MANSFIPPNYSNALQDYNDAYWQYRMQQGAGNLAQALGGFNGGVLTSYQPNYNPSLFSPVAELVAKVEPEKDWLRRRVDEVCWKAA